MKIMTIGDMDRLRASAPKSTHLSRYDLANDKNAKKVLDVECPDCLAKKGVLCVSSTPID